MTDTPQYLTTDFYLAALLCHRGGTLLSLRRLGPKKVEFRFRTGDQLHELLRLYWSGNLTQVIPWDLFMRYHRLKCLSTDRYDGADGSSWATGTSATSPAPDADQ
jgi:hypothetical protein